MDSFEKFISWAEKSGWIIEKGENPVSLPVQYRNISEDYKRIISGYSKLSNPEENVWFLLSDDFSCADPDEFAWDTFQKMSLDATDDEEECAEISAWWDGYFPIVMSVGGDYIYYAIELSTGRIVEGSEPEFEEVTAAADSLEDFFDKIADGEIVL